MAKIIIPPGVNLSVKYLDPPTNSIPNPFNDLIDWAARWGIYFKPRPGGGSEFSNFLDYEQFNIAMLLMVVSSGQAYGLEVVDYTDAYLKVAAANIDDEVPSGHSIADSDQGGARTWREMVLMRDGGDGFWYGPATYPIPGEASGNGWIVGTSLLAFSQVTGVSIVNSKDVPTPQAPL
jgi:hypothetical protein